jgi:hypothetical protein
MSIFNPSQPKQIFNQPSDPQKKQQQRGEENTREQNNQLKKIKERNVGSGSLDNGLRQICRGNVE